jgi:hypothetical protein
MRGETLRLVDELSARPSIERQTMSAKDCTWN